MDLKEAVRDLAKRSRVARDTAETEEATKNAVIMPFIRALGFDVFDLRQVVPEFTCDVGVKKGEKVDYALKISDRVTMLVEAKPIGIDLGGAQYTQLYRYFSVTDAQIAILTNGQQVWFFTDIDEKNKLDKKPFFKFDFESFDDDDIKELVKFHRDKFDIDVILETAATLKYTTAAAQFLEAQMQNPDDELVRIVGKQIYDGNLTKQVIEQLRPTVKSALTSIVRDKIQERLTKAFGPSEEEQASDVVENIPSETTPEIETTEEEWQAYYIVRAICSENIHPDRVNIRDAKSYCSVLVDNNNRKTICRFWFNSKSVKYIGFFGDDKKEQKIKISDVSDIFQFKEKIISAISKYSE